MQNYTSYAQQLYAPTLLYNDHDLELYAIFYLSNICFWIFLYKYNRYLHVHMIPAALLLTTSFFWKKKSFCLLTFLVDECPGIFLHPSIFSIIHSRSAKIMNNALSDDDDDYGFCGMVDQRKVFSLIFSRDHCQRPSPSQISDMWRAGFEPAQNLSLDLVKWSCAVVITTTPQWFLVLIKF